MLVSNKKEIGEIPLLKRSVAELLGTYGMVFAGTGAI